MSTVRKKGQTGIEDTGQQREAILQSPSDRVAGMKKMG
jgi:hypothetical protein